MFSGFGTEPAQIFHKPPEDPNEPPATVIKWPVQRKDDLLLQEGTADPEMYKYTAELNYDVPIEEVESIGSVWSPRWKEWAGCIEVPVMAALAGEERMWKVSKELLSDLTTPFTRSERVDGSIINGAPHNVEMSYWGRGWYARSFGFALECAATFGRKM